MAAAAPALPAFDAPQIRVLQRKLAFPGPDALFKAARKEAARVNRRAPSRQEVKEAIASVPTSQVYRKQKYDGAVAALAVDEKWQADLASLESLSVNKRNLRYTIALLCVDVMS